MNKDKKVLTINNEEVSISQCRKFESGYYKIGDVNKENSGDCYLINDKYYRVETDQIVFDHEIKQYNIKNSSMNNGIVGFDENKNPKYGYFTATPFNVEVKDISGTIFAINEEILKTNLKYRERLSDGKYYHIDLLNAKDFNKIIIPRNDYKTSLPYDSRNVLEQYVKNYNNIKLDISKDINEIAKILKNYTFGLEFETTKGFIPNRLTDTNGLIPLRDGSISGIEYVTVPLSGAKGLQTIVNICDLLEKRTEYNDTCSLHVHIGNVPRTKEFILAFFLLTCSIQNEIFEMYPIYKKYNFGVKNKNYSKPFPIYELISEMDKVINSKNINENFNVLFKYLSMGHDFSAFGNNLDQVQYHPADANSTQKWNIRTRYYNHNLIPLIFGNKTTVEFRIHTPTFDFNKILSYLILNIGIIDFANIYTKNILQDPTFLREMNISRLMECLIFNSNMSNKFQSSLFNNITTYFARRRNNIESQNKKGNIRGCESEIRSIILLNTEVSKKDILSGFKSTGTTHGELNEELGIKTNLKVDNQYAKIPPKVKIANSKWMNIEKDLYNSYTYGTSNPFTKDDIYEPVKAPLKKTVTSEELAGIVEQIKKQENDSSKF